MESSRGKSAHGHLTALSAGSRGQEITFQPTPSFPRRGGAALTEAQRTCPATPLPAEGEGCLSANLTLRPPLLRVCVCKDVAHLTHPAPRNHRGLKALTGQGGAGGASIVRRAPPLHRHGLFSGPDLHRIITISKVPVKEEKHCSPFLWLISYIFLKREIGKAYVLKSTFVKKYLFNRVVW